MLAIISGRLGSLLDLGTSLEGSLLAIISGLLDILPKNLNPSTSLEGFAEP